MKKFAPLLFGISLVLPSSFVSSAHADEVSAPNVVAPAQPIQAHTGEGSPSTPQAVNPQTSSPMGMALPFILMVGVMYFLMIRPEQKRRKTHQATLSSIKAGDEVVTSSGIIGTIVGMSEKVVTLEVSKNVQLKIMRNQVNQIVKGSINDLQATS